MHQCLFTNFHQPNAFIFSPGSLYFFSPMLYQGDSFPRDLLLYFSRGRVLFRRKFRFSFPFPTAQWTNILPYLFSPPRMRPFEPPLPPLISWPWSQASATSLGCLLLLARLRILRTCLPPATQRGRPKKPPLPLLFFPPESSSVDAVTAPFPATLFPGPPSLKEISSRVLPFLHEA